jgi:hypothetical protein
MGGMVKRKRSRALVASLPALGPGLLLAGCAGDSSGGYDNSGYPAYDGTDLDCADIGHEVPVSGADPHGLDADGDGVGCEGT